MENFHFKNQNKYLKKKKMKIEEKKVIFQITFLRCFSLQVSSVYAFLTYNKRSFFRHSALVIWKQQPKVRNT